MMPLVTTERPTLSTPEKTLLVQPLVESDFAPYGVMLGTPPGSRHPAFSNQLTDFWHQHIFNAGAGGQPEVLWVNYRNNARIFSALELHRHTQQAIVPLNSSGVIHVVALSAAGSTELAPDLSTLKAFWVASGQGVCMNPGCWHATFVADQQVSCLMLTRSSTTRDLVQALESGTAPVESIIQPIPEHRLALPKGLPS